MHAPREDTQPWYRQFWPWFLISLPATAVVAGLYTLDLAIDSNDGLVKDDYYKQGLAIYQDAARVQAAHRLDLDAQLQLNRANGRIQIQLNNAAVAKLPSLNLTLAHPTRAHQDQQVKLQSAGNGRFVGRIAALAPANWRVSIEPPSADWRISGRLPIGLKGNATSHTELQ
jgi:hypothetical protein